MKTMATCRISNIILDFAEDAIIDSDYLFNPSNVKKQVYESYGNLLGMQCDVTKCQCIIRLGNILKRYSSFIEHKNYLNESFEFYDASYNDTNLLTDLHHLLGVHSDQFEYIYNVFNSMHPNKTCAISKCRMFQRNSRNRRNYNPSQYADEHDIDHRHLIRQQLIDRIHSYYLHSVDIGFILTNNDRIKMMDEHHRTDYRNNDKFGKQPNYDVNVAMFSEFTKSKRKHCSNILRSARFTTSQNNIMNEYSFGSRYFYWSRYKNNDGCHDKAHWSWNYNTERLSHPPINGNSTLRNWYIPLKYDNLKQEVTSNNICQIALPQFDILRLKAITHGGSLYVRTINCPRRQSAAYYDLKPGSILSTEHIIVLMLYCNFDTLSYEFSKTYRLLTKMESIEEMKLRHREYYWFGRLIRECVECFGMRCLHKKTPTNIHLFHGISKEVMFSSIFASIKGPLSTSTHLAVALNFSQNDGMIMDLDMYTDGWRLRFDEGNHAKNRFACFDCQFFSDYIAENEILFIGGYGNFIINTIIKMSGINYEKYINGIRQFTYNCIVDGIWGDILTVSSKQRFENQMVFRLLSYELNENNPNHPYAYEFHSCPDYIKTLLHNHCANIKEIRFLNETVQRILHEKLFKDDNGWIKLDIILTLFPNIERIIFDGTGKDLSYFKKSGICSSILSILQNKNKNNLKNIKKKS
eukprot:193698_1